MQFWEFRRLALLLPNTLVLCCEKFLDLSSRRFRQTLGPKALIPSLSNFSKYPIVRGRHCPHLDDVRTRAQRNLIMEEDLGAWA